MSMVPQSQGFSKRKVQGKIPGHTEEPAAAAGQKAAQHGSGIKGHGGVFKKQGKRNQRKYGRG